MPWVLPESDEERLALAKGYPFAAPNQSFLFHLSAPPSPSALQPSESHPADAGTWAGPQVQLLTQLAPGMLQGRHAVLGHGSNRAPSQLTRKFCGPEFSATLGTAADQVIPVTYVWLDGYDVVYSAHVTRYGAIASNLTFVENCRVRVAVTWLTDLQLARMHDTEGPNYPYGRLEGVAWKSELPLIGLSETAVTLHVYKSQYGCLPEQNMTALSMAAVTAQGRPGVAAQQEEALALVRHRHHPEEDLDWHILANIADAERRNRLIETLAQDALESQLPHFRLL